MADGIEAILPGIPVVYMSGYPAGIIAARGVLKEGDNFIQKPFDMSTLERKLRCAMGEECQNSE
jgi:FixJ family two-component response regulator